MRSRATGSAIRDAMGGVYDPRRGPRQSAAICPPPATAGGRRKNVPFLPVASCLAAHPMLSCAAVRRGEFRMARSSPREAKDERSGARLFESVVNPFCGTLADDLDVERTGAGLKVVKNGCSQSVAG